MKYNMDGIVRGAQKEVHKPIQIQKGFLNINRKRLLRVMHIFWKKNMRFVIIGMIILIIISVGVGIFVFKRKTIAVTDTQSDVVMQEDSTNANADVTKDNIEPQKSNTFHIKIDTKEFKVDTDIIEGNTDGDLHKGVVHQEGSSFPSQHGGNVVITGHRWYPGDGEFSKVFQDMDKLKKDDKITIEYKNRKYIYSVNDWRIVETADTKFLQYTKEPQLTIYTCHPKFTSQQRLVYTASLDVVEDM